MKSAALLLVSLILPIAPLALGASVQSNYWYQSTVTTDANGPLDLLAELNYNDGQANAPIAVVMHGYWILRTPTILVLESAAIQRVSILA